MRVLAASRRLIDLLSIIVSSASHFHVLLAPDGKPNRVPRIPLLPNYHLFQANPALVAEPCKVRSRIPADSLGDFASAEAAITCEDVRDLGRLCLEFEFWKNVDRSQSAQAAVDGAARQKLQALKAATGTRNTRIGVVGRCRSAAGGGRSNRLGMRIVGFQRLRKWWNETSG
jgi:hypothetical protein